MSFHTRLKWDFECKHSASLNPAGFTQTQLDYLSVIQPMNRFDNIHTFNLLRRWHEKLCENGQINR